MEAMETRMRQQEAYIRTLQERLRALDAPDAPDDPSPSGSLMSALGDLSELNELNNHASATTAHGALLLAESSADYPSDYPSNYRGPATVTLADRGPDQPVEFKTHADAGRWLERHGVNANTAKTWHGWRRVHLTPSAVLSFAIGLKRVGGYRVSWSLRHCEDEACICRELLD
jgi:hypothetical protein